MTAQMMVALGEDGIKSIEDFAGCAADDLVGWSERKNGETKKFDGLFSKFDVSRVEAEQMIVRPAFRLAGSRKRTWIRGPKKRSPKPNKKHDDRA